MGTLNRFLRCLPLLLATLALPSNVLAHRLDEYLQATLVTIEPDNIRFQINLTPGVAVAKQVLALIDRDNDGVITTNEAAAYAELLKRDLVAKLDGRNVELTLATSTFPTPAELRTGLGIILMDFSMATGPLAAGSHRLTMENQHLPAMSVYLFNASRPRSDVVQIKEQKRNETQSVGEIAFDFHPLPRSFSPVVLIASVVTLFIGLCAGVWRARRSL